MSMLNDDDECYIHPGDAKNPMPVSKVVDVLQQGTVRHLKCIPHLKCLPGHYDGKLGVALAEALKTNVTLQTLSIDHYLLDDTDALAFAEALGVNTTLQSLRLNTGTISSHGTFALSKALRRNTSLRSLSLTNQMVQNRGILALASMLTVNTTLQTLDLSSNFVNFGNFGRDVAAYALIKVLTINNTTLCNLYYGAMLVEIAQVENMFKHNASLEHFGTFATMNDYHSLASLDRNCAGKQRTRISTVASYKVLRLRLGLSRDTSRLLAQYVYATRGQMCWVQ